MTNAPKLDGQISLADHREAMRMVAVGYVCEIEAMRKSRNAADDEATRLTIELAEVRRQVGVLVSMATYAPCSSCDAKDFCNNQYEDYPCEENIAEWSARQAKEGGK